MSGDRSLTRARLEGPIEDVLDEYSRAVQKHGDKVIDGPDYTDAERVVVLLEEVGEVAHEVTYDSVPRIVRVTDGKPTQMVQAVENRERLFVNEHESYWVDSMTEEQLLGLGYRRETSDERLYKELIQTATMALAFAGEVARR